MKKLLKLCMFVTSLMFITNVSYAERSRGPRFSHNIEKVIKIERNDKQGRSLYHNPNRRKRNKEPRFRQGARPNVPGLYVDHKDPKQTKESNNLINKYTNPTARPAIANKELKRVNDKTKEKKKAVPFYMQQGSTADYKSFGKDTKRYYEYE